MANKKLAERLSVVKKPLTSPEAPSITSREKRRGKKKKNIKKTHKNLLISFKNSKKNSAPIEVTPLDVEEFQEEELAKEDEISQLMDEKNEARERKKSRIVGAFLGIACAYLVFLIYGVFVTNYQYREDGTIMAQKMSVKDIKDQSEFNQLMVQYESCRKLYEKTLSLDYRLAQGLEDPVLIAPEYEGLLDEVQKISVRISALDVPTKYTQTIKIMMQWIQNDIAVYLQNMSSAISTNNGEKANNALVDKTNVYYDFAQMTSNLDSLGSVIPGIDLTDLNSWTPDNYTEGLFSKKD